MPLSRSEQANASRTAAFILRFAWQQQQSAPAAGAPEILQQAAGRQSSNTLFVEAVRSLGLLGGGAMGGGATAYSSEAVLANTPEPTSQSQTAQARVVAVGR